MDDGLRDRPGVTSRFFHSLEVKYQYYLDRLTPHTAIRWVIALISLVFFASRILLLQGFYIVAYAVDPALEFEDEDDGPVLPSKTNDEFRPFMRRLPEFKFWHSFMKATLIAITCTFFEFFDVPVFWPILVMYFFILTFLTLKRQIMHMIKYRYIPFTVGKPRMQGKEDTGKVVVG